MVYSVTDSVQRTKDVMINSVDSVRTAAMTGFNLAVTRGSHPFILSNFFYIELSPLRNKTVNCSGHCGVARSSGIGESIQLATSRGSVSIGQCESDIFFENGCSFRRLDSSSQFSRILVDG